MAIRMDELKHYYTFKNYNNNYEREYETMMAMMACKEAPPYVYHYDIFEEEISNSETGRYRTFGIELTTEYGEQIRISDVSLCEEMVLNMVSDFNLYQLLPVHFHETVVDRLQVFKQTNTVAE